MRIDKVWVVEELELVDVANDLTELIKNGELEPRTDGIVEYFRSILEDSVLDGILLIINGTEFAKYFETDVEIEEFVRDYLLELMQENLDEEKENEVEG